MSRRNLAAVVAVLLSDYGQLLLRDPIEMYRNRLVGLRIISAPHDHV